MSKFGPRPKPLHERFWAKVSKSEGLGRGDCWEWIGARDLKGYGRLGYTANRTALAHRVSWEILHGPAALPVLHKCDNPSCVRPEHLFLGTIADNNADMKEKGRMHCKLTPSQVAEIRERCASGTESLVTIGRSYGISKFVIWTIKHGKAWKNT